LNKKGENDEDNFQGFDLWLRVKKSYFADSDL